MISYAEFAAAGSFLSMPSRSTTSPVPSDLRSSRPTSWTRPEIVLADSSIQPEILINYTHAGVHSGVISDTYDSGLVFKHAATNAVINLKNYSSFSSGQPFQFCNTAAVRKIYSIEDAQIEAKNDAATFVAIMPGVPVPHIWGDTDEVVLEWMFAGKHAILSFAGDGHFGYTLLVGDSFVPGSVEEASVQIFPPDLEAYLMG